MPQSDETRTSGGESGRSACVTPGDSNEQPALTTAARDQRSSKCGPPATARHHREPVEGHSRPRARPPEGARICCGKTPGEGIALWLPAPRIFVHRGCRGARHGGAVRVAVVSHRCAGLLVGSFSRELVPSVPGNTLVSFLRQFSLLCFVSWFEISISWTCLHGSYLLIVQFS